MAKQSSKVFISFIVLLSLLSPINSAQAVPIKIAIVYAEGGRGDNGANDLAALGIARAIKKHNLNPLDIREQITNGTLGDRITRVRFLARNNYKLIICIGSAYADTVKRIANEYPNTQFAIIDDESVALTNVSNLSFALSQGIHIAGAALAAASKSGQIAFIADKTDALAPVNLATFTRGAKSINSKIRVSSAMIDQSSNEDIRALVLRGNDQVFSTWSKSDLVISTIAGLNNSGRKALISGVLPDQFFLNISAGKKNQYLVITKRYEFVVEQMIATDLANKNILDILDAGKGIYGRRFGIKEGGVSVVLLSRKPLPLRVQTIATAIKSGKIKP